MEIAIPIYDGFTALDAIGPYSVLHLIPGAEVRWLGEKSGPTKDETATCEIVADAVWEECREPEILVVPGGSGNRHLIGDERYAGLRDIGPDSTSKPVTDDQLQRSLGVPRDMLDRYVEMFIHMGLVERVSGGLVVPGAVFTSAEMMNGANEAYDRIVGLISALRGVGFSLGENIS